jgi:hypothetical protein
LTTVQHWLKPDIITNASQIVAGWTLYKMKNQVIFYNYPSHREKLKFLLDYHDIFTYKVKSVCFFYFKGCAYFAFACYILYI